jgi:hypothetical protein
MPFHPLLDGLHVREPSANPRRNTIVRLLRGEVTADYGADGLAVLAEQLLALITEQCARQPTILVIDEWTTAPVCPSPGSPARWRPTW